MPSRFLPGWGMGSAPLARAFEFSGLPPETRPVIEYFPPASVDGEYPVDFEGAVDELLERLPPRCRLGGWSLGAMLALGVARRAPERIASLTLIAGTASFLARPHWPWGCSLTEFRAFQRRFRWEGRYALPDFIKHFCQGDMDADAAVRFLQTYANPPSVPELLAGLDWLAEADLSPGLQEVTCPVTLIHGACDPLIPLAAADALRARLPNARLIRIPGKAHAPFLPTPADARFLRECAA